jgi:hypothetical protein
MMMITVIQTVGSAGVFLKSVKEGWLWRKSRTGVGITYSQLPL